MPASELEIEPAPDPAEATAIEGAIRRVLEEAGAAPPLGPRDSRWRAAGVAQAVAGLAARP